MHLELGSVLCRAQDIDIHLTNVCWAAELLYIRNFAKFGRGSGNWGWELNQIFILPCKIFCFPGLILCLSLTPNLQPGHNDRLNEIHFEDIPSCSTSQRRLWSILVETKLNMSFILPFSFLLVHAYLLYSFNRYLLSIFFYEVIEEDLTFRSRRHFSRRMLTYNSCH